MMAFVEVSVLVLLKCAIWYHFPSFCRIDLSFFYIFYYLLLLIDKRYQWVGTAIDPIQKPLP